MLRGLIDENGLCYDNLLRAIVMCGGQAEDWLISRLCCDNLLKAMVI